MFVLLPLTTPRSAPKAYHIIFFIPIVVLPRPSLLVGLKDRVVKVNSTVQLECHFKAITAQGFAYFVWLKDNKSINIYSSKYHFQFGTVPGTQHRMITKLRIFEFNDEDEGKYSCYCKYNQLQVMRQIGAEREILSHISSANIRLTGKHPAV